MIQRLALVLVLVSVAAVRLHAEACSATTAAQADPDTLVYPKVVTTLPILNNDRGSDLRLDDVSTWFVAGANGDLELTSDRKAVRFLPQAGKNEGQFQYNVRENGSDVVLSALVQLLPGGSGQAAQTMSWTFDGPVYTFKLHLAETTGIRNVEWNFGHGPVLTPWRGTTAVKTYPDTPASYNVTATVDYYDGKRVPVGPVTVTPERQRLSIAWDFVHDSRGTDYWKVTYGARAQIRIASVSTSSCNIDWSYFVDWGDGVVEPLNEQGYSCLAAGTTVGHVYAEEKSYTIGVFYTTGTSTRREGSSEKHFFARYLPPSPSIQVDVTSDPKTRRFSVYRVYDEHRIGSSLGPSAFEWDFDDGTFAVSPVVNGQPQPVAHTFVAPGPRMVRLKVTDHLGEVGVSSHPVDIADTPPTAAFAFRCDGLGCSFDASGSQDDLGIARYSWNVGGAVVESTTPSLQYHFPSSGAYAVTLDVDAYTAASRTPSQRSVSSARKLVQVTNAGTSAATRYFAVTPCRAFDSREGGGAPLAGGSPRAIPIGGRCGVPATARDVSVALSVAAVGPSGDGHLQILSSPVSPPPSSVVNFTPERGPRAGNTVVPLASDGTIWALAHVAATSPTTHVVVDVVGYFASDATPPAGAKGPLAFTALEQPCRVFDSGSSPLLNPNTAFVKVLGAPGCGGAIPAALSPGGGAAALNVTLAGPTAAGHLIAFPSTAPWTAIEKTSLLNLTAGVNIANGTLMSLGNRSGDDLGLFFASSPSGGQTRFVVDATGYFSNDGSLAFHAIQPCRAVDTRDPARGDARPRTLVEEWYQMRGNCGVPMGAAAVAVTATVVGPSASGHLKLYAAGAPSPITTILNLTAGDPAVANTAVVRIAPGVEYIEDLAAALELSGAASGTADLVLDVIGYFAPASSSTTSAATQEQ